MKTFAERLTWAMNKNGMTQATLADAVGMSQPSIWKLTNGKTSTSRKLVEIAQALNVRPEWLANGEEPAEISHSPELKEPKGASEKSGTGIQVWDDSSPLHEDEVEVPYLKDIELAAGDGSYCDEDYNGLTMRFSKNILRRVGANTDGSGVLCFPARGNSMEPVLPDGTDVAVDCNNKRIDDGKLYAINVDGLKRVKMLYRRPGGKVVIRSYNREEFQDEETTENALEIIGRVFWYSVVL